jgi:carboxyl-terminal processing protease
MKHTLLRRSAIVGALCLVLVVGAGFGVNDNYFEIAKNIDIFGKVMREVNMNYVDEVEPNKFTRFGLDAMLKTLDPYTDFISASEIEDLRFMSTGQYGGIGARVGVREKIFFITETNPGSPAEKAGLLPGDEILQIDNELVSGKGIDPDAVSNLLRGQPKTKITLKIKRWGDKEPISFVIERDDIKVKNVEYYGMVAPGIGYVALTGFTKDAGLEARRAIEEMKQKNGGLKGIVLDLRSNPGGLLNEALNVSNLFVAQGEKIVETRGRGESTNLSYEARNVPLDTETPLVVLINQGSASASEIVAGTVQDLDRGVVVGRKSFGKGLVQTTRPLSYQTQIKLTTARYYTPSGRCIQAIDYKHDDNEGGIVRRADSLKKEFKTRHGRTVLDAGGIDPDVKVPEPEYHKISYDLRAQYVLFDFATRFRISNPSIAPPKEFAITDAIYNQFTSFATQERKFAYASSSEKQLNTLREQLKKEGYLTSLQPKVDELASELKKQSAADIVTYRPEISRLLAQDIVSRYYKNGGEREASFATDGDIKEAIAVLTDAARYKKLLAPQAEAAPVPLPKK